MEFSRKHTANVQEALEGIRRSLGQLVEKRQDRRDSFVKMVQKAMETTLGDTADDVQKILSKTGIHRTLAKKALQIAQQRGSFTIFALVDAMTRLTQSETSFAGERLDADQKASALLDMVRE